MIVVVSEIAKINIYLLSCLLSVFWESPDTQHRVESTP